MGSATEMPFTRISAFLKRLQAVDASKKSALSRTAWTANHHCLPAAYYLVYVAKHLKIPVPLGDILNLYHKTLALLAANGEYYIRLDLVEDLSMKVLVSIPDSLYDGMMATVPPRQRNNIIAKLLEEANRKRGRELYPPVTVEVSCMGENVLNL